MDCRGCQRLIAGRQCERDPTAVQFRMAKKSPKLAMACERGLLNQTARMGFDARSIFKSTTADDEISFAETF